jgi:hypothetical protein
MANVYVSAEREIGPLLTKRACSNKKPFANVNLFSDRPERDCGALCRAGSSVQKIWSTVFGLCSRNPGLRVRPDPQVENRPPFFLWVGEHNVLPISKPADFLF